MLPRKNSRNEVEKTRQGPIPFYRDTPLELADLNDPKVRKEIEDDDEWWFCVASGVWME